MLPATSDQTFWNLPYDKKDRKEIRSSVWEEKMFHLPIAGDLLASQRITEAD